MDTTNIILWSISLTLAVAGISFGVIASINATKANRQIKDLVSDQMVSDEASKFFLTIPQSINDSNIKILKKLNSNDASIKFNQYGNIAPQTRMIPISKRTIKYLIESEYKDLSEHYMDSKMRLDNMFNEIINDYGVLTTDNVISKVTKAKLIKYHKQINMEQKSIIKQYYSLINV